MTDAAWPEDALEVGRIGEAWGLKGWFRIHPYAVEAQVLLVTRRWHLQPATSVAGLPPAAAARIPAALDIREAREHGDGLVAAARGIDDRSGAEALRGARIFVGRSSFPAAGKDEFYWVDLIGLAVVNRDGVVLGEVVGLIENGPQSVLRVRGAPDVAASLSSGAAANADAVAASGERLIPFVAAFIDDVDLAARRIVVDWGLDY
jgi:16S rRNA processing protein RimM